MFFSVGAEKDTQPRSDNGDQAMSVADQAQPAEPGSRDQELAANSPTSQQRPRSYSTITSLEGLLEFGPSNRAFYEAMTRHMTARPGEPLNLSTIGREIGLTRAAASLIMQHMRSVLSRLGLETPAGSEVLSNDRRHLAAVERAQSRAKLRAAAAKKRAAKRAVIIRMRESESLEDHVIAERLGVSVRTVMHALYAERKRRKMLGQNSLSLNLRRRRTPVEIAAFRQRITEYREQGLSYDQMFQQLRTEFDNARFRDIETDVRAMLADGVIEHHGLGNIVAEETKAVLALTNTSPSLTARQIHARLIAAGYDSTLRQVYSSMTTSYHGKGDYRVPDDSSFRETYERLSGDLYRYALSMVHEPEVAKDIVAAVFAKAFISQPRLYFRIGAEQPLDGWLVVSTRYACLQYFKTRHVDSPLSALGESGFEPANQNPNPVSFEFEETLPSDAINILSTQEQRVVTLCVLQGYTVTDAAKEIAVSRPTAGRLLRQGLAKLRDRYLASQGSDHSLPPGSR